DHYGNAGSPHKIGQHAKDMVQRARDQVAAVVAARRHEVLFTSGATESNNLAILGLEAEAVASNRRHIVSTQIEHHAVLEPLQVLERRGFSVTRVAPQPNGQISASEILDAIRPETILVSVMQVNNETGVIQPIAEIAEGLASDFREAPLWFHVDAAQGFGKLLQPLRHPRIDLISVSGHKIHGPQGIGALIARRRSGQLPPLRPLVVGGGQEMGLRPGTLPVALIAGFGLAAELALQEHEERSQKCREIQRLVWARLAVLRPVRHGEEFQSLPHVLNLSFPDLDSEQVIEALWEIAAVSDGAACTSICATASHVLTAMGLPNQCVEGGVRLSWSSQTDLQSIEETMQLVVNRLQQWRFD
ncbi:MAG: aminotransferase class V-fold PLP-dependent enzyme, partial [Pirellulaceae bacterium]|nr:aminotransferase class V-fold PLP-dependent enzyme [Pirellulaceae bacterium]